jgi:hypothetical protein
VAYGGDISQLSPWRTDLLELFLPIPEDQDPWGLNTPPPKPTIYGAGTGSMD